MRLRAVVVVPPTVLSVEVMRTPAKPLASDAVPLLSVPMKLPATVLSVAAGSSISTPTPLLLMRLPSLSSLVPIVFEAARMATPVKLPKGAVPTSSVPMKLQAIVLLLLATKMSELSKRSKLRMLSPRIVEPSEPAASVRPSKRPPSPSMTIW